MRKFFLLSTLLLLTSMLSMAQSIQFTPFAGYTFADKFNIGGGTARIGDGFAYGGILSLFAGKYNALDLTYSRQGATGSAYSTYQNINVSGPVNVNYIFAGGTRHIPISDEAMFFTGLNLGVGFLSSDGFKSVTKFAAGMNGGIKYFLNDRIGLRLQANLNFPVTDLGASFWWDPSSGTSVGVTSYVPVLQFGFTGGLIFKLK